MTPPNRPVAEGGVAAGPVVPGGVASALGPVVDAVAGGELPVSVRFWDGSTTGASSSSTAIVVRSPAALRRLLWSPNELGLGRAYVSGEIDIEGDVFEALAVGDEAGRRPSLDLGLRGWRRVLGAAWRLGLVAPPPPPPPEEARLRGRRHSPTRDKAAITYHYDISDEFYRLVLGATMTYSCAFFADPDLGLDQAQHAKHDLICRKLGLQPGMRLLDVGCGWGAMLAHAAARYKVRAVGVTISAAQASVAARRLRACGLDDRVEIRLCDYREVVDGPYDAICSIGMFEHVGLARLDEYFTRLLSLLAPTGRLLNHGISRPDHSGGFSRSSFIDRYVFPDGELHEVGRVVSAMQHAGFEVRDVESLREHYARTLRCWVENLQNNWEAATALVGQARARVWRLYMAASALNFEAGRTSIHQILGVKSDDRGRSAMAPTRASFAS